MPLIQATSVYVFHSCPLTPSRGSVHSLECQLFTQEGWAGGRGWELKRVDSKRHRQHKVTCIRVQMSQPEHAADESDFCLCVSHSCPRTPSLGSVHSLVCHLFTRDTGDTRSPASGCKCHNQNMPLIQATSVYVFHSCPLTPLRGSVHSLVCHLFTRDTGDTRSPASGCKYHNQNMPLRKATSVYVFHTRVRAHPR